MRKPTFGVTAFAVVTLSVVGVLRVAYEPLLPPSPTEYLVTVPPSEPQPAPIVEIGWKRNMEQGIIESKRRKLGLLILFIDPSNTYAKHIELQVFRNPEMARFVNRTFVPVKINLDQYPEWRQCTLPRQRLRRFFEPGVELVVTNQDGALVSHYRMDNPFQYIGPESILPYLIDSKSSLNQGQTFLQSNQSLQSLQNSDIEDLISANAEPIPAFQEFGDGLTTFFKPDQKGILKPGSTKIAPLALRFLAKLGKVDFSCTILKSLSLTPLYDVVDGGFFREATVKSELPTIDTGKSSSGNALNAQVAAQLACATRNGDLKQLAIDIGNEVITDFLDGDSISTSRMNDQLVDMRSKRSSLTEKKLNSIFTSEQRAQLMTFVSKSQSPDQDLLSLKSLSILSNQSFTNIRQTLREKSRSTPGLSESEHIAVVGYLAARFFELYRYTDDPRFLSKGKELADDTFSAQVGNSVAKIYGKRELGPGWLGSYLAIADCGLADYAATGEIYPLRNGENALKQAITLFRDPQTGLLNNVLSTPRSPFSFTASFPDLADRDRESMNSQAIRLAFHYSVIAEDEGSRGEFLAFAQSMMARLNSVMHHSNEKASGYYDAIYDIAKNLSIVVSGANRVKISNQLAKMFPFDLVYPMTTVNISSKDAIYIRRAATIEGPYSPEEIQKKMADSGRS